jgi:uncharacterized protein YdiU (UPF0061 family)
VPTTRSLSLIVSRSQGIQRPWYSEGSRSHDPDRWVVDPAAITTRVASSFLRVGQIELFARRARRGEHPNAAAELEQILVHAIDREYAEEVDRTRPLGDQLLQLTAAFRDRLTSLVAHWSRVGYCQGNFNSDNTAVGGFTLDYGPFGFMELFDPRYQPWTGGGPHFSFFNQPAAAEQNFHMFWKSVRTWPGFDEAQLDALEWLRASFGEAMRDKLDAMWTEKLGLPVQRPELVRRLLVLMQQTPVDYTILFRSLSGLPATLAEIERGFYQRESVDEAAWTAWLADWRTALELDDEDRPPAAVAARMKAVNPRYVLREWLLVPAYRAAARGELDELHTLQGVMTRPYEAQDVPTQLTYDRRKPLDTFGVGGVSHMSCSS